MPTNRTVLLRPARSRRTSAATTGLQWLRRRTKLVAFAVAAAMLAASTPSAAAGVRGVTVVDRPHAGISYGIADFDAGYGVVAWVEVRSHRGRLEYRIGAKNDGRVIHRRWTARQSALTILRRLDQRTGRAHVRVLDRCAMTAEAPCRGERLLDPSTLRTSANTFAANPVSPSATRVDIDAAEDATRVTSSVNFDSATVDPDSLYLRPSSCTFGVDGRAVAMAPLGDCADPYVRVRYGLVLAWSRTPSVSAPDGYFAGGRLHSFDLADAAGGWRDVGSFGSGKGGSNGVQSSCLL
ncbi:MAG: hypothetical protein Q7T55_04290, partial [Solirubrobacteraceae bacterium]|nr:hypothetical protein [Solirubrobacteraceae bacterium]